MVTVVTEHISVKSRGETDIINITDNLERVVNDSGLKNGIVTIFVPGSTGSLTTIEYEPGLVHDISTAFERLAPKDASYEHDNRWRDGNGHSHVRASIMGSSLTVPFVKCKLTLGTWQQIVFIELDTRSRIRDLVIQIIGE